MKKITETTECFAITTYCNTQEKVDILNMTIDNIKQFDIDIMIHAHFPLPVEIQQKVEYYISSENCIVDNERKISWYWKHQHNYKLFNANVNYNYTVLKQIDESSSYLFSIGYGILHFINYDANINDKLYGIAKKNQGNSIFYQNFITTSRSVTGVWFTLNIKDKHFIKNITSKEEYLNSPAYSLEEYLANKIEGEDVKLIDLGKDNNEILFKNEVSFYGISCADLYGDKTPFGSNAITEVNGVTLNFDLFFKKEGYYIFGGYFNKTLAFIFYNITKKIDVKIQINDKMFNFIVNNDMFFMDTGIKIDGLKYEDVKMVINDLPIDDVLIDRMIKNKIELV
jgi:hypothetical protein